MVKLNDAWLEEFKLVSAELSKINTAQAALQVRPKLQRRSRRIQGKLVEVFKGSRCIRAQALNEIADKYKDAAAIYFKDLIDAAAAMAKGKADVLTVTFIENLADLSDLPSAEQLCRDLSRQAA